MMLTALLRLVQFSQQTFMTMLWLVRRFDIWHFRNFSGFCILLSKW